jgi:hypothetical protein
MIRRSEDRTNNGIMEGKGVVIITERVLIEQAPYIILAVMATYYRPHT